MKSFRGNDQKIYQIRDIAIYGFFSVDVDGTEKARFSNESEALGWAIGHAGGAAFPTTEQLFGEGK